MAQKLQPSVFSRKQRRERTKEPFGPCPGHSVKQGRWLAVLAFGCAKTKTSLRLSSPAAGQAVGPLGQKKCAHQDLNLEPTDYESVALTD